MRDDQYRGDLRRARREWCITRHRQKEVRSKLVRLARALGATRKERRRLADANFYRALEGGLR